MRQAHKSGRLRRTAKAETMDVSFEGSLDVKLPILRTDDKQSREEAERRERSEERRVEEKEYQERRWRCAKR